MGAVRLRVQTADKNITIIIIHNCFKVKSTIQLFDATKVYKRIPEGIFFLVMSILSLGLFFRLRYCIVSEVLEYSVRVVPSTFMLLLKG